jgi:hypothetical protein
MKDILSILLWLPAIAIRWTLILLGLIAVPFSLVADGAKRTPKMWKFWADAEAGTDWWTPDDVPTWGYLYLPVMALLGWWSMSHWHALVTIYFIFAAISSGLIISSPDRWTKFWWFAIRNPTRGFAAMFTQPILEPRPNPDDLVYKGVQKSASRFLRHGWQSEFWYLRAVGEKKFEFRIGWKFADGTPGFTPTIQFRYGS